MAPLPGVRAGRTSAHQPAWQDTSGELLLMELSKGLADQTDPRLAIIEEAERRADARQTRLRICALTDRASAQLLGVNRLLSELRQPSGNWSLKALIERLTPLLARPSFRVKLSALAIDLASRSDSLSVAHQDHYNRLLHVILPRLRKSQARAIVRPFINHRLKDRRELEIGRAHV